MATYGENFSSQTPSGIRPGRRPIWGQLWFQVVIGMAVGIALGHWQPNIGAQMKPFGDIFILLIRMMIAPIIFCTVVHGIAGMNDMRRVGRVALKALIYFEVITTAALIFALVGVNLWQPGVGMHVNPHAIDTHAVATYANQAKDQSLTEFFLNIVPKTFASAFTQGEVLQVLFVSLLFAFAASALGPVAKPVVDFVDILSKIFFRIIGYIMYVAPIGAFGALAFTVGKFGAGSLASLGSLIAEFFVVSLAFTFIVLGGVAWWAGVSLLRLLNYIRDELVIVAATTSSETVLPRLIEKLRLMGCEESVVGLVIPTGYSFNLDGTCLYLATAAVFLAQATDTPLDLSAQIGLILVLLLTSKGAAGVAGAAFIVLAASLGSVGGIPIGSIALILGIHRVLAEALTFVNVVGNCVATIVVSKWEGALNHEMLMATIGRRGAARPASLSKAA
jgi:aerobic C4-dicarboxylate transport protein